MAKTVDELEIEVAALKMMLFSEIAKRDRREEPMSLGDLAQVYKQNGRGAVGAGPDIPGGFASIYKHPMSGGKRG